MSLTETSTYEEAILNFVGSTITVIWRDRIFKNGEERMNLRTARSKVYTAENKAELDADGIPFPNRYITIMGW